MIDPELIDKIAPHIKIDTSKSNWVEMGLVDNAPTHIRIAFDHYKEMITDAEKRRIEL